MIRGKVGDAVWVDQWARSEIRLSPGVARAVSRDGRLVTVFAEGKELDEMWWNVYPESAVGFDDPRPDAATVARYTWATGYPNGAACADKEFVINAKKPEVASG